MCHLTLEAAALLALDVMVEELNDRRAYFIDVSFECEVTGIVETNIGMFQIPLEGFCTGWQKERIILAHTANRGGWWSRKYF